MQRERVSVGSQPCITASLSLYFSGNEFSHFYGWHSVKVQFLFLSQFTFSFSYTINTVYFVVHLLIFLFFPACLQATALRGSLRWPDVVPLKKRPSPAGGSRDLTGGCPPHTPCTIAKRGGWRNSSLPFFHLVSVWMETWKWGIVSKMHVPLRM